MSGNITTTGELRAFLSQMMVDVKNGEVDIDKASRICKLAGQINESFYAETKVAKMRTDAGEAMKPFGQMALGAGGSETSEGAK